MKNPSRAFPLDEIYINLAIVESKEQQTIEEKLFHVKNTDAVIDTFEEIYGMKSAIHIKDIFEKCKGQKKQIVVLGRAGIGKTTFCRYAANQWAKGEIWQQYQLVILIPFRNLNASRYPSLLECGKRYSLVDIIKIEYFLEDLSEEEEKLLKEQLRKNRILWLLDGYDEIYKSIPPYLKDIEQALLETEHHIVTSRPYMNMLSSDVVLEITGLTDDNVVRYIEQFFDQVSKKFETQDVTLRKEKLVSFLKSNPRIWGIAHIPINLELICTLSCGRRWPEKNTLTMTNLYDQITEDLCRRYLIKRDDTYQQKRKPAVYNACKKELMFLESLAFHAMEEYGLILQPDLLCKVEKEINVSLDDCPHLLDTGILKSFEDRTGAYPFDDDIIGTPVEAEKNHYFIHLSFQEYFAAKYLVNALQGNSRTREVACEFIKTKKYDIRYQLLLNFASGLLIGSEKKECIQLFWNSILDEPIDLVGFRQIQLIISCIEETAGDVTLHRLNDCVKLITKWIWHTASGHFYHFYDEFQGLLKRSPSIAKFDCVIDVMIALLSHQSPATRNKVCSLIGALCNGVSIERLVEPLKTARLNATSRSLSDYGDVCRRIAEKECRSISFQRPNQALSTEISDVRYRYLSPASVVLCQMGVESIIDEELKYVGNELLRGKTDVHQFKYIVLTLKLGPKEFRQKVIHYLFDPRRLVRTLEATRACSGLWSVCLTHDTDETIDTIRRALKHENEGIKLAACEALGEIGEHSVTDQVIHELAEALADESNRVKLAACKTLGKISVKAANNEVIDALVKVLTDQSDEMKLAVCHLIRKTGAEAVNNELMKGVLETCRNSNTVVKLAACQVLGKVGKKAATNEVIDVLVQLCGDPNSAVKSAACEALGEIGEHSVTDQVIHALAEALADESNRVKLAACKTLGKISVKAANNEVIDALVRVLNDQSDEVKVAACKTLEKISVQAANNEVIDALVKLLSDQTVKVKLAACKVLLKTGTQSGTNTIINVVATALENKNDSDNLAVQLLNIMEKPSTDQLINLLTSKLKDGNDAAKSAACRALAKIGETKATEEVRKVLVIALRDRSQSVQLAALGALEKFRGKTLTPELLSHLIVTFESTDRHAATLAACVFRQINDIPVTSQMVDWLKSGVQGGNRHAIIVGRLDLDSISEKTSVTEVVNILMIGLKNSNPNMKSAICKALGNIDTEEAYHQVIAVLMQALNDQSDEVKLAACQALEKKGVKAANTEVTNALVKAFHHSNTAVKLAACQALEKIGVKASNNEATDAFVIELENISDAIKVAVCKALTSVGQFTKTDKVTLSLARALTKATKDRKSEVEIAVCEALDVMDRDAITCEVVNELLNACSNITHHIVRSRDETLFNILWRSQFLPELDGPSIDKLFEWISGEKSRIRSLIDPMEHMQHFLAAENPRSACFMALALLFHQYAVTDSEKDMFLYGSNGLRQFSFSNKALRNALLDSIKTCKTQSTPKRYFFE